MNESNFGGLDASNPHHSKHVHLGNWKINIIMVMLIFTIIGLLGLLGSMNQLYKKLNHVESFCSTIIEIKPEHPPSLKEEKLFKKQSLEMNL